MDSNGIKQGSNSKLTVKHNAEYSKTEYLGIILSLIINCSYNNIARNISLLDKIVIFVFLRYIFIQVRAFEIGEPLKIRD